MNIIVKITQEELNIVESWIGQGALQGWLQHALDNKIRQRVDASILEVTNFNPEKMTLSEKLTEFTKVKLKSREERNNQKVNHKVHNPRRSTPNGF